FAVYLSTVRKYAFEETPDYDYLRGLFDTVLASMEETDDGMYDWRKLNNGRGYDASSVTASAARQNARPARASAAYKAANPNHISNQALRSYDNVAHRQSTPNMNLSAANTPGKLSRDRLDAADATKAKDGAALSPGASANADADAAPQMADVNGASGDAAAYVHGNARPGRAHEKQGFMFKLKSAFGCCSSSSV
ncbi:Palmitoylated plasma membrane-bound casein kinase, partial [Coemansia spiralis]